MSYPPAQPPIPPGMAPPMMAPPGYGFPPMGMMPMMGMLPQMMRTTAPSGTTATSTAAKPSKKLIPQEIPKEAEEKPPVTTVFVGNISDRAPDAMVRQMLQRCGNVLSWKRVQGASGKLQAFGFCEYENPEATLCCIRLLNDWKIVDKNLLVKVDAKTKTLLEEYKKKKAAKKAKEEAAAKKAESTEEGEESSSKENGEGNGDLDEFTLREDRVAKAGLDAIMREYADELAKEPPPDLSAEEKKEKRKEKIPAKKDDAKESIDEMDLDQEDRDLINREINKFRDAHKDEDEKEQPDRTRDRERRKREEDKERERRDRERERREREREQERREWEAREREKESHREKYRSRTRSRSRSREASYSRDRDRNERDRGDRNDRNERDRSERPERNERKERDDRSNDNQRDYEDEEEVYERKRMERKMREKEAAYQEKLKAWVTRERKRGRDYEKEREKEEDRKAEESREARRLREFLEDYDDVRDDLKYYKGSALKKRLTEREKEMEADARDRQREKEEIEEIRRRLLDQGHPDIEVEMARIEREREEHLIPRLNKTPPHVSPEPEPVPVVRQSPMKPIPQAPVAPPPPPQLPPAASVSSQGSPSDDEDNDADDYNSYNLAAQSDDDNSQSFIGPSREEPKDRLGFSGIKFGAAGSASQSPEQPSKRKKLTVGDVFNQDDEQTETAKKRRLVPIDYSEDSNGAANNGVMTKPTTAEEKRKCIKNLIDKIPTAKAELFAYELDWSMVDTNLMDRRIKPWVNKKIVEYIGEEEPTLTDFICQKVMAHSPPQNILNDVSMVLDEEAEVFVVKMWRLLIYEIEAKKLGLVK